MLLTNSTRIALHEACFFALPEPATRAVNKHLLRRKSSDRLPGQVPDLHLISFPKSGRTWLRLMLGVMLARTYNKKISSRFLMHETLSDRVHLLDPRIPCVRSSHNIGPFVHDRDDAVVDAALIGRCAADFAGQRVLLLYRDPRDVVISWYHALHGRTEPGSTKYYGGSLSEFLREPDAGLSLILRFYRFLGEWIPRLDAPCLVTYEELHADTAGTLRRILDYVGTDASAADVEQAIEACRFDAMREMERKNLLKKKSLQPFKSDSVNHLKTRKGKVGSHREELGEEDRAYLEQRIAAELHPYFAQYRR